MNSVSFTKGDEMTKQLFRLKKNKMIGGVAIGLAEYFDIDPVLVRALFVITTLAWGIGILSYIVLWIIVPEKQDDPDYIYNVEQENFEQQAFTDVPPVFNSKEKNSRRIVGGVILILLGSIFFMKKIIPEFDFEYIWPIFLIGIGFYLIYRSYIINKVS
jgi:phage shock protein PspC (stress-responsive transcriptional regulator)